MAKKNIASLVSGIIGNNNVPETQMEPQVSTTPSRNPGRPRKEKTSEMTRTTLVIEKDILRKMKMIAAYDDCLIQDIINKSLKETIARWEKERGEINLP